MSIFTLTPGFAVFKVSTLGMEELREEIGRRTTNILITELGSIKDTSEVQNRGKASA